MSCREEKESQGVIAALKSSFHARKRNEPDDKKRTSKVPTRERTQQKREQPNPHPREHEEILT